MCVLAVPEAHFSDDTACKCPRPPRSAGAPCPLDEAPHPGTVLWEQRPCGSGLVNRPSCCPGSCPILLDPRLLDTMLHPPFVNAVLWLLVPDGSPRARPSTRTWRGCEVARCPCWAAVMHSRGGPLDQLAPVSQPSPAEGNPPPPLAPSRLPTAPGAPGGGAEACPGNPPEGGYVWLWDAVLVVRSGGALAGAWL